MKGSASGKCKVVLDTEEGEEKVWALSLGGSHYRIQSVPFFAYNISLEDIVEAHRQGRNLRVRKMIGKSGHRTLRVIFEDEEGLDSENAKEFLTVLERLGCVYEGFPPMLLAVDVPSEVDIEAVIESCEEAKVEWEYGDPQLERPVLETNP
ncbi:DUF4265 domain-containing protein [Nostoc sp.]|uniref:DUF4265 domain-containing protein n=1 Tax=Nostoc sp. TaxID=1180 RepID=UPI002FF4EDC4